MTTNDTLTAKQTAFVRALLSERGMRAAAKAAGIGESTAYRWARKPEIQAALADLEGAALSEVTRGLLRLATQAIGTLEDAMTEPDARLSARIRAADVVLARLLSLRALATVEERLTQLEVYVRSTEHGIDASERAIAET